MKEVKQFLILPIRRPVEERVVHALGKAWHVEVNKVV